MTKFALAQLDLFGDETQPPRSLSAPPPFAPFPDALLRRLNAKLRMVRAAEVMPWPQAGAEREADLFLSAVERLPPNRRGDLAEAFRTEIARLS
jgi:hypothetical protein